MKTKTVQIEKAGKRYDVVMTELTVGQYDEIVDQAFDIELAEGGMKTKIKWSKFRLLLVMKSIKEVKDEEGKKVPINAEWLRSLRVEEFEKLFATALDLNPFRTG